MSGRFQNTGRGSSGRSTGRGSYRQGRGNGQYNRKQNGNGAQKEKKFHPLTSGNIPHCSIQDLVLIAKVQWVHLRLPCCFAAIGGRRRLFTSCHVLLGRKAIGTGSTHKLLKGPLPDTPTWYPADAQIVLHPYH